MTYILYKSDERFFCNFDGFIGFLYAYFYYYINNELFTFLNVLVSIWIYPNFQMSLIKKLSMRMILASKFLFGYKK